MDLRLTVDLPRDIDRMNTLRHVLDDALARLEVDQQVRTDIGLIVSETWANVIAHVRVGLAFQVVASVGADECVIEVTSPASADDVAAILPSEPSLQVVTALADSIDTGADGLLLRVRKKL